ncbi:MAG: hypothetical protein J7K54_03425 [Candidatus Aenigmarchaeota archaeon]|nr:hypothetical protein [Candidatus Aenigmarchaeota archaeon]
MRAQAAFEYMLVAVIVLAFLVPLWIYTVTVNNEATNELSLSYARNAVESITNAADLVYSQGSPAMVRIKVFIPDNVISFNLTNHSITASLVYYDKETYVYADSNAVLNGSIPSGSGTYWIEVTAIDNPTYDVNIYAA